jgi:GR25 family glycosyltransferase involved in LPS biosynthesis
LKLFWNNDPTVEKAYIITLPGNELSERHSAECQKSCEAVGQEYEVWQGFDGMVNPIGLPKHSETSDYIHSLKIGNHHLTRPEIACVLSHASLWLRCAVIDRPIVILEHDAIMVKRFTDVQSYNSIVWLGAKEWIEKGWDRFAIPPHATMGNNYHFILRAHAYAIDPTVAKNLLAHLLKYGICEVADVLMRADLFNITHQGFYAYNNTFNDIEQDTTIWPRNGDTGHLGLNHNLEW